MDIDKLLLLNYLPYAKGTIVARAVPGIDGLKPSQRRVLYTMQKMGLLNGERSKSQTIVGQVMQIHPHGDSSVYESMVRLAAGNESLNVPYIDSKGNFGKVYTSAIEYGAPRYTSAKLSPIAKEMFEGMNNDAVDFVNNYDDTTTEPVLLPVKFPNILVNNSSGIAVGYSTEIPSFALKNVCNGTIGILDGTITNSDELMEVLGVPEFPTGGFVHADQKELNKLGKTGKGSFVVSGVVTTYPDKIVINEIPYGTTIEGITDKIRELMKDGEFKEISNVVDKTGLKGLNVTIDIKRNANSKLVLQKLVAMTNLRMRMSFRTRVIVDNRLKEFGMKELLDEWISFRLHTINRINTYKSNRLAEQIHLLNAWDIIKLNLNDVARLITDKNEDGAKEALMAGYKLDDIQADYLLDMRIRMFTTNNLERRLTELKNKIQEKSEVDKFLADEEQQKKLIISELKEISEKYGNDRKTMQADMVIDQPKTNEIIIDDSNVTVVITKSGLIKRLVSLRDITNFELPEGEEELYRWHLPNNENILVFTKAGEVHKILVDSIDASRGAMKEEVYKVCRLESAEEIIFMDMAGDYSGHFNLLYPNGRGVRVKYERASGKREKYVSLYAPCETGSYWITKADEFFMITAKRKAAYCDLTLLGILNTRTAFKVARVNHDDNIFGLQPIENVPNMDEIDIAKYDKSYTIKIGEDVLW